MRRSNKRSKCTFGFEPGDIVSQVMSFGASKPIAVRLIGTDYDEVRKHAEKIAAEMRQIPYLRDIGFEQTLDYPTVEVEHRPRAGGVDRQSPPSTSSARWSWRPPRPGSPTSTTGST